MANVVKYGTYQLVGVFPESWRTAKPKPPDKNSLSLTHQTVDQCQY